MYLRLHKAGEPQIPHSLKGLKIGSLQHLNQDIVRANTPAICIIVIGFLSKRVLEVAKDLATLSHPHYKLTKDLDQKDDKYYSNANQNVTILYNSRRRGSGVEVNDKFKQMHALEKFLKLSML